MIGENDLGTISSVCHFCTVFYSRAADIGRWSRCRLANWCNLRANLDRLLRYGPRKVGVLGQLGYDEGPVDADPVRDGAIGEVNAVEINGRNNL